MKINAYKKCRRNCTRNQNNLTNYGGKWANFETKAKKKKMKSLIFTSFFQKTQKRNISIHISISLINHQKSNNNKNLLFYSISVFWNSVLIYFICLA